MELLKLAGTICWIAGLATMTTPGFSAERARVVLLGTGTPVPDPSSSGPAVAVVVNGQAYLFDAGAGVVRRAEAAAEKFGIPGLEATNLTRLFFTHLHSDHTLGYPDVILTPWVVGRRVPLEVYGPKGTTEMTQHLTRAYAADIKVRTEGFEGLSPRALTVNVHEIAESGLVYRDTNVSIRAISVPHGSWPQAFGYSIESDGRTIVISGDTAPSEEIEKACRGCDVLVHEVYSADRFNVLFPKEQAQYHSTFHTSTKELAELASKSKPKLLVLYHQLYFGSREEVNLEKEVKRGYSGAVVNGRDLTVY
jgi:ribonuclease BN (tRNA processing enzyme)